MSARTEIAAAAKSAGLDAHPYFEARTAPGTAWVRLDRIDYPNPFGGIAYWNLVVVLPQDLAAAEQYLEEFLPGVVAALADVLPVASVTPQRLSINGVGELPCVFISGHREADS